MARVIEQPANGKRLLDTLSADRVACAYQLGVLTEDHQQHTRWYWVLDDGVPTAVLTIYEGISVPAVFTWGQKDAVAPLAARLLGQLPDQFQLHLYPECAAALTPLLELSGHRKMVRTTLSRERFVPKQQQTEVTAMKHSDTADIIRLYATYPDLFFEPYQLESGHYFGVREAGDLICAAGIHMVLPHLRLAVVGNVVTLPWARGRGLAQTCTSRLCAELFKVADLLVLDLPVEGNSLAHVFAPLGFEPAFHYERVIARRRPEPALRFAPSSASRT